MHKRRKICIALALHHQVLLAAALAEYTAATRCSPHQRDRTDFSHSAALLLKEDLFTRMYRMPYHSFLKLVALLEPKLRVDPIKSRNRTGLEPVSAEIKVAILLRYLAGGSMLDIHQMWWVSKSHCYAISHEVMNAIVNEDALQLHFPETTEERRQMADGFRSMSTDGAIAGCIGVHRWAIVSYHDTESQRSGITARVLFRSLLDIRSQRPSLL
eukprot:GHVU01042846.1.p1 GENE.GHVU01042846.1~~GHVU01042846.1.p1  ORF type:complete len:214 (-),score=5.49 GHVU01042846.1:738-1379(-)